MANFTTGLFSNRDSADKAVNDLRALGFEPTDISVVMNNDTRERHLLNQKGNNAVEGLAAGAAVGGTLTAIVAGLMATGTIAAVAATGGAAAPLLAGPIAAALAGAGAGGLGGGVIGALVGAGVPKETAHQYDSAINDGSILIGVNAHGREKEIERLLRNDGGTEITN